MSARVFVAIPHTGFVESATHASLADVCRSTKSAERVEVFFQAGAPVELVRHQLVARFLHEKEWSHLFFVDSDMGLPADVVDRLLALDKPIACLPCPMFAPRLPNAAYTGPSVTTNIWMLHSPPGTPVADRIVRFLDLDDFPAEPFDCYATGLACCLIRRDVFEKMKSPHFATIFSADGLEKRIGEDSYFFEKARELGYRPTVDPGAVCDHFKEIDNTHATDFYTDSPRVWEWRRGSRSTTPAHIAAVVSDRQIHAEQSRYLLGEESRGRTVSFNQEEDWSSGLKRAVREFLSKQSSDWLLLLNDRTVPPADFLDRVLSDPPPIASGIVVDRRLHHPEVFRRVNNAWTIANQPSPSEPTVVDGVSVRALLISREILSAVGSSWIRAGAGPKQAGLDLCDLLYRTRQLRPTIVPIGCRCYETDGLLSLLRAKSIMKDIARKARTNNA